MALRPRNHFRRLAISIVIASLFVSCAFAESITIAAAISLKDALTKVAEQYKSDTGQEVEFAFGSSGLLSAQIQNGAPIDLFISAANKQIDDLAKAGLIERDTQKVIAGNALVLIVPADAKSPPESVKALADTRFTKIAIGEPKSVPAGQYARQAIQHEGMADAMKDKLILCTNVRQVLDYVERGEVDAGIVYATDAKMARGKVRVMSIIDERDHEPIVYPAAVVKATSKRAAAMKFLDYLLAEKSQSKLKEFGFIPPPPPTTQPNK